MIFPVDAAHTSTNRSETTHKRLVGILAERSLSLTFDLVGW